MGCYRHLVDISCQQRLQKMVWCSMLISPGVSSLLLIPSRPQERRSPGTGSWLHHRQTSWAARRGNGRARIQQTPASQWSLCRSAGSDARLVCSAHSLRSTDGNRQKLVWFTLLRAALKETVCYIPDATVCFILIIKPQKSLSALDWRMFVALIRNKASLILTVKTYFTLGYLISLGAC